MPHPSFPAGRPLLEAAIDLCHRIFTDFKYDRARPPSRLLSMRSCSSRHGVCQDFAHVMIACLRSLRLPARYVSGYLRTAHGNSPARTPRMRGCRCFAPASDGSISIRPTT